MQSFAFARYISIVFSGARTSPDAVATARVFLATPTYEPVEVHPPAGTSRYWTRKRIADWLLERLTTSIPTLVGIDYGFSFPLAYFTASRLTGNWDEFLEDFSFRSPTGRTLMPLDLALCREAACGDSHFSDYYWRRLTEIRAGARSPFCSPAGSPVWKSTCTGIRWLAGLRRQMSPKIHCWPFDGWDVAEGRTVVVETYPAFWQEHFSARGPNLQQQAAYVGVAWMRQADASGSLHHCFLPDLSGIERSRARVEGWMFGVE